MLALLMLLSIAGSSVAADVEYHKNSDGVGYFTAKIYKDADTGEVFKIIKETNDTIYLDYLDSGSMLTKEQIENRPII